MKIGIDFCKKYAQVSIYNPKSNTVDTVKMSECDEHYSVPVCIAKQKDSNEWFIADEAAKLMLLEEGIMVEALYEAAVKDEILEVENVSISGRKLLEIFFARLINKTCQVKQIESICFCVEQFEIEILDMLSEIIKNIGISEDKIEFINRNESDMYYVLSQNKDIWYGNVAIFDYKNTGLTVSMLNVSRDNTVVIENEVYEAVSTDEIEKINDDLISISDTLFDKKTISAVFLTGERFNDAEAFEIFVNHICARRRIFIGQNIYSKGACYCAIEHATPCKFTDKTLFCEDKVTYTLELEIVERGKASRFRIVKPGTNWYRARKKYYFFVYDKSEIVLHKKQYLSDEEEIITIPLEDFPARPDRTTKIGIGFDFLKDNSLIVTIKDRGFGGIYKSSDRIITRKI